MAESIDLGRILVAVTDLRTDTKRWGQENGAASGPTCRLAPILPPRHDPRPSPTHA